MRLLETDRRHWLAEHVNRWVDAGIVAPEQGRAIVRFEAGDADAPASLGGDLEPTQRRLPILAEALAYCGSALALVGGAFVVTRSWSSMPTAARLAVGVVVAMVGLVAGNVLRAMHEPGADRLGGFLWLVGAGGVALTAGVAADAVGVSSREMVGLTVGAAVAVVGGLLWRNLDRPLQLITTVAGAMTMAVSIATRFDLRPWVGGVLLWSAALVCFALAASDRVRPALVAMLLSTVGLLIGAGMLNDLSERLGAAASLATAAGVVFAGVTLHQPPVLGVGVLGTLQSLLQLFALYFRGPVASMLVATIGLLVVVVVVVRSTHRPHPR